MDKEQLNWRSFADVRGSDGQEGAISSMWNLQGTPTLFVLDHQGVIRHRWLGSPGEPEIDRAINALIKEAESSK